MADVTEKDVCVVCGLTIDKFYKMPGVFGPQIVRNTQCVHCGLAESIRITRLLRCPFKEPNWRLTKDGRAPDAYIQWHRKQYPPINEGGTT